MSIKKSIIAILLASIVAFAGVNSYAASGGIYGSVTKTKATGTYNSGVYGEPKVIYCYYYEKHTTTGQYYNNSTYSTATGAYTSVTVTKTADSGYNFRYCTFKAYLNGSYVGQLTVNAS